MSQFIRSGMFRNFAIGFTFGVVALFSMQPQDNPEEFGQQYAASSSFETPAP